MNNEFISYKLTLSLRKIDPTWPTGGGGGSMALSKLRNGYFNTKAREVLSTNIRCPIL